MKTSNLIMKPNILSVVKSDYISLLGVIFPLVGIFLCFDSYFTNIFIKEDFAPMAVISSVFVLLGVVLFYFRVSKIFNLFKTGIEVEGLVTNIFSYQDRGKISYQYEYSNELIKACVGVHRSTVVKNIKIGDSVKVLLNADMPQKSIIKTIYI